MKDTQDKPLDARQRKAIRKMRSTMINVAHILIDTVDKYDRAIADLEKRDKHLVETAPGEWQLPKDWLGGDHEFDEWEAEE